MSALGVRNQVQDLKRRYRHLFAEDFMGLGINGGWFGLIERLCVHLDKLIAPLPDHHGVILITQIKEKFGVLNVYWRIPYQDKDLRDEAATLFQNTEIASICICEVCSGSKGSVSTGPTASGWIKTLCSECREARNAELAARAKV